MYRYPIINLGRSQILGQGRTLLEQACDAINYYNMFPDVDEDSMAAKRSAIAAMKGLFRSAGANTQEEFEEVKKKIRKACSPGEALLSQIQPTTPTMTTPYHPVPSSHTGYTSPPTPAPGPGTPGPKPPGVDIASIDTTFRVSSREENPPPPEYQPFTVSSREENPPPPEYQPFTVSSREENPPPYEPPPPYQQPPPVASQGNGCFYCPGQGYRWGAPSSGCERTGLNQSDCESIASGDRGVRSGIPYGSVAFGGGGMPVPGGIEATSLRGSRFPVVNLGRRW
jgi:hypothetical protein